MQIHEITQRRVDEGMWDSMRDGLGAIKTGYQQGGLTGVAKASVSNTAMNQAGQQRLQKQAAKASDKLTAQGYGASQQQPSDNWEDKYKALQQNPGVMSYAKNLAAGWAKNGQAEIGKTTVNNTPPATTKKTVATTKKPAAGAGAFGQIATQLTTSGASSTGGQTQATPTGLTHTANPNNPNQPQATTIPKATNSVASAGVFGQMANQLSKVAPPTAQPATKIPYGKAPAPGAVSEPVSLGGKQLNPKNPNDAQVLAAIKKQGKLHEATVAAAPNANQVKTAFVNWSDGQLATRVPETGATITMNDVRKLPNLTTKLSAALNQVVQTQGTPAQVVAVEEYVKLAVAGVQALAQSSKNGVSAQFAQQNIATTAGAGSVTQALQASGINTQSLQKFGAAAKQAGSSMQVKMTADPFLNNLAKQAGYTLTR